MKFQSKRWLVFAGDGGFVSGVTHSQGWRQEASARASLPSPQGCWSFLMMVLASLRATDLQHLLRPAFGSDTAVFTASCGYGGQPYAVWEGARCTGCEMKRQGPRKARV